MDFEQLVQKRRSIRKFLNEELSADEVRKILRAGLMSPTSKSSRAWQFVVVDDKAMLEKLSKCKRPGPSCQGCAFATIVS
jgi:nitroreductase